MYSLQAIVVAIAIIPDSRNETTTPMNLPEETETALEVNLIPMVDVLFVMLIFVILVSLGAARMVSLPVNLPTATTAEATQSEPLTITIAADGQISVGSTFATLATLIPTIAQQPQPTVILLNADAQVPHGQVVQVLDRLRQLEGVQLAIATNLPPSSLEPAP